MFQNKNKYIPFQFLYKIGNNENGSRFICMWNKNFQKRLDLISMQFNSHNFSSPLLHVLACICFERFYTSRISVHVSSFTIRTTAHGTRHTAHSKRVRKRVRCGFRWMRSQLLCRSNTAQPVFV